MGTDIDKTDKVNYCCPSLFTQPLHFGNKVLAFWHQNKCSLAPECLHFGIKMPALQHQNVCFGQPQNDYILKSKHLQYNSKRNSNKIG